MKLSLINMLEPVKKELLYRVFSFYASFGEPMNTEQLKSSKFIKLLKEA
jgi:hypothetical protein